VYFIYPHSVDIGSTIADKGIFSFPTISLHPGEVEFGAQGILKYIGLRMVVLLDREWRNQARRKT
jgi:hypothetical protein